jgi:hypothetical protein
MENSDRQYFKGASGLIMWLLPLVMGFVLIMFFYVMSIIFPSQGYTAAGPLGAAIIFVGSGVLTKTLNDRLFLDQRISALEKLIEIQKRELAELKGK